MIDFSSKGLKVKAEPVVWVTWLAKVLADPSECTLPVYIQTRFSVLKEDTFTGDWAAKHGFLLEQIKARLSQSGRPCSLEQEIAVTSRTGLKIAGAMDVWAPEHEGRPAVIIDAKTGRHKPAHRLQVNLYQLMAKANDQLGCNVQPIGVLAYADSEIWIKADEASPELSRRVAAVMEVIAAKNQPLPMPSRSNCRFCPVGHLCPDRHGLEKAPAPAVEAF